MEAMKALAGDLPAQDHPSDRKGKAVDTPVVDNQGNSAVQDKRKSASEHDHVFLSYQRPRNKNSNG